VKVFKSVGHAEIHLALRAFKILYICQLCFATLSLAMCCSAVRPTFLVTLVLFELALTSFYMLVPDMPRRYAKFGLPFEAQRRLAYRAENDIVIIMRVEISTLALMIVRPPMISTVNFQTKFAFEGEEVLLSAMLHSTVLSKICKFHIIKLFY